MALVIFLMLYLFAKNRLPVAYDAEKDLLMAGKLQKARQGFLIFIKIFSSYAIPSIHKIIRVKL